MFYFVKNIVKNDGIYNYNNHTMCSLTKQIVNELMEKFKDENPETVFKMIQEMRNDIRQSNIELFNTYEQEN
jgi:5,10-methenyltetrahydromethanopterin hydrogenase